MHSSQHPSLLSAAAGHPSRLQHGTPCHGHHPRVFLSDVLGSRILQPPKNLEACALLLASSFHVPRTSSCATMGQGELHVCMRALSASNIGERGPHRSSNVDVQASRSTCSGHSWVSDHPPSCSCCRFLDAPDFTGPVDSQFDAI